MRKMEKRKRLEVRTGRRRKIEISRERREETESQVHKGMAGEEIRE